MAAQQRWLRPCPSVDPVASTHPDMPLPLQLGEQARLRGDGCGSLEGDGQPGWARPHEAVHKEENTEEAGQQEELSDLAG